VLAQSQRFFIASKPTRLHIGDVVSTTLE